MEDPETYRIIGAAMQVHRSLGHGLLESAYQEALEIEFEEQGIPARREVALPLHYRGRPLKTCYRMDFVCFGDIVVELKANGGLGPADIGQAIHYVRGGGMRKGLLLHFGTLSLEVRRIFGAPRSEPGEARKN